MATGRHLTAAARALQAVADDLRRPPADRRLAERALVAYQDYVTRNHEDYTLQEAAGLLIRERVAEARRTGRVVKDAWLRTLQDLADADEPTEVILHGLAVAALCDGGCAAADAADAPLCRLRFRAAFERTRLRPDAVETRVVFVDSAADAAERIAATDAELADELICLAAMLGVDIPEAATARLSGIDPDTALSVAREVAGVAVSDIARLRRRLAAMRPAPTPPVAPERRGWRDRWRRR